GSVPSNGIRPNNTVDLYSVPAPTNQPGAPFVAPFNPDTLPLVIAGPRIINSYVPNTYVPDRSQLNIPVPPTGTGGTGVAAQDVTTSVVNVSGLTGTINYATVNVTIQHPRDSDLKISLVAPDGTEILLSNRRGANGSNYTNTTSDDQAAASISTGLAPFTGSFKPEAPLGVGGLRGKNPNGTWTLKVEDAQGGLAGKLL